MEGGGGGSFIVVVDELGSSMSRVEGWVRVFASNVQDWMFGGRRSAPH